MFCQIFFFWLNHLKDSCNPCYTHLVTCVQLAGPKNKNILQYKHNKIVTSCCLTLTKYIFILTYPYFSVNELYVFPPSFRILSRVLYCIQLLDIFKSLLLFRIVPQPFGHGWYPSWFDICVVFCFIEYLFFLRFVCLLMINFRIFWQEYS